MATLFSHYKSMGIFSGTQVCGQIWPNSKLLRVLMHIIIICKYEKDRMKNSQEKVVTPFWPLQPYLLPRKPVVRSSHISNSSKLLCMSSLPVSMKRIPSRTSEKKWQHRFSKYNTICCHGNQWSDLDEFQTHPSSYACPHGL